MTTVSHNYADRISAEHPTVCYVLGGNSFVNLPSVSLDNISSNMPSRMGKILYPYNSRGNEIAFAYDEVVAKTVSPIIYGSERSVYLSGVSNVLCVPAFGMMNVYGKYKTHTLEFWTTIKQPQSGKRKIVGPLTDTEDGNGLYINQTSFILQIGNKKDTAAITDFNRPFLIQIVMSENVALLIVNGELVISLKLEDSDVSLLSDSNLLVRNGGYLAFGEGVYDFVALYPYKVTPEQALRRFVIGHGVRYDENVVDSFKGKPVVIDYSTAGYSTNHDYTTSASWKNSVSDNIKVDQYSIANYQYELPKFNSSSKTMSELEATGVFNLKQSSPVDWSGVASNFEVSSLSMMDSATKGFYMHGYYTSLPTSEQIVFKLVNSKDGNTFTISVNGSTIYYKLKYNTSENKTIAYSDDSNNLQLYAGKYNFIIGINIDYFSDYFIKNGITNDVKNFFANPNDIKVYIAGDNDLTVDKTLSATIYSVKFLTKTELANRGSFGGSAFGRFIYPSAINTNPTGPEAEANARMGSYELRLHHDYLDYVSNGYYFTVGSSGYWKTDIPLSFFCKTVKDAYGNDTSTFDFVQFNIDFDSPILRYTDGLNEYLDTTSTKRGVRTYVSFDYLNDVYNDNGRTIEKPKSDRVVYPPNSGWASKKYEITDGFIIYPPSSDVMLYSEYTMVITVDFNVEDTINNNIVIQTMEFASKALNGNMPNPIGTQFGQKIIPYTYTLDGSTKIYNYKAYNPFIITKNTSPHSYMGRDSGIRLVGWSNNTSGVYRGIKIPINEQQSSAFNVSAIQLSVFYNAEVNETLSYVATYPDSQEQVFEITTQDRLIKFYLTRIGVTGSATLSAVSNGITDENILFYINGELSQSPIIDVNTWTTVGIVFADPLLFNSYAGEFDIVGRLSIDNFSYYQVPANLLAELNALASNLFPTYWSNILLPSGSPTSYYWGNWDGFTWESISTYFGSTAYSISSEGMYEALTGTSRMIGSDTVEIYPIVRDYRWYSGVKSQKISYAPA